MQIDQVSVLLGLVLGGIGYNAVVAWFEKQQQGYTAFFVVGGVLWTMAGAALLIGLENALIVLACFAASGAPMVIGSMLRNRADGDRARKLAGELLDGEETAGRVRLSAGNVEGGER